MDRMVRTDLALEQQESVKGDHQEIRGVVLHKEEDEEHNLVITTVEIQSEEGSQAMKKPKGTYITLESQEMLFPDTDYHREISNVIARYIRKLLPFKEHLHLLVVGLGNEQITPDALGPLAAGHVNVTRHMYLEYQEEGLEECGSVGVISALVPGVMARTGMETAETVGAVIRETKPEAMIVIDALAARTVSRLNTTIQITDTGISPGYGVGNFRGKINEENMGIPVLAIGVPTVIDAATIVYDTLIQYSQDEDEQVIRGLIDPHLGTMYVTPNDIDATVEMLSFTVAEGINQAFARQDENML